MLSSSLLIIESPPPPPRACVSVCVAGVEGSRYFRLSCRLLFCVHVEFSIVHIRQLCMLSAPVCKLKVRVYRVQLRFIILALVYMYRTIAGGTGARLEERREIQNRERERERERDGIMVVVAAATVKYGSFCPRFHMSFLPPAGDRANGELAKHDHDGAAARPNPRTPHSSRSVLLCVCTRVYCVLCSRATLPRGSRQGGFN